MQNEILESLNKIALKHSRRFCMSCYIPAPSGRCPICHSDDLAHEMAGVGLDWSLNFVVKHLIETELTPVNTEEAFEQYVEACYPDYVQVGWLSFDVCTILKELDPTTWSLAKAEFIDTEESEGNYISFDNGSTYYLVSDLEEFIDEEGSL